MTYHSDPSLTLPQCSCSNLGFLHGQKCIHVVPNAYSSNHFHSVCITKILMVKVAIYETIQVLFHSNRLQVRDLHFYPRAFKSQPSLLISAFTSSPPDIQYDKRWCQPSGLFPNILAAMCNVHVNRVVMWWTCNVLKLLLVDSISSFTCFSYCSHVRSTCMSLVLSSSVQGSGKLLPFPSTFALVWCTLPSAFLAASTWLITLMHRQPCVIKAGELSLDQGNTYVNRRLNTCIDD